MDLHLYTLEEYANVDVYSEDPWVGVGIYMYSISVSLALYGLGYISFLFLSFTLFFRQLFLLNSSLSLRINHPKLPNQVHV